MEQLLDKQFTESPEKRGNSPQQYMTPEQKMEDLKQKIKEYKEKVEEMETKTTLKSLITKANENPLSVMLQAKKTLYNREAIVSKGQNKKEKDQNQGPVVPVNCVAFNQNEKFQNQFATVDESGKLAIWDAKKGIKYIEEPKVTNGLLMTCAIESKEGKLVACGGIDTKLHIYQINPSGKKKEKLNLIEKVKELTGHYGVVTCCGFLSSRYLVSGSNDSSIMLWDFERPGRFLVKYGDHQNEVLALDVFNLDGNIIVSGSNDATTRVWDIRMKTPCIRIFEKIKCGVSAVKFMPDCVNTIAIGCDDSSIKFYDLRAVGKVGKLKDEIGFESLQSLCFSNSGRLLFSSYNNNKIKIWDVIQEQKVYEIQSQHKDVIKSISLSLDGTTLVSGGKDGIVTICN